MSRKGNTPKRDVLPDPVYGSVVVAKLINSVMLDGKKGVAQKIVYDAFDQIKEATGEEPLEVFEKDCLTEHYFVRRGDTYVGQLL